MNNEYPLATRRAIVDTSKLHALNRAMPAAPAETYFHCTYAKNLPGIAKRGLVPSPAPGLLRAVAKNHRGVYLTEPGGILFWFGRLKDWAFHDSDDAYEDGLVPVVLKVSTACRLIEDELGTEHARARAAVCPRPIPPGAIRVWDGADWIPVRDYESIDLRQACTWDNEEELTGFNGFKSSNQNPLNPLNDRVLSARANPAVARPRATPAAVLAEAYYHCTFSKNLPGIAKRGLVPSELPNMSRRVAGNHRGVYLTERGGMYFWFSKLAQWAWHDSRDPRRDGLVPVVLKVSTSCRLIEDAKGSSDARARAAVCPRPIPPGAIRVWNGTEWIPVREHASLDLNASFHWRNGEDLGLRMFFQNPLFPMAESGIVRKNPMRRHSTGAPLSRTKLPRGWSIRHVEIAADDPDLFGVSHRRAVVHVARSRPAAVRRIREHPQYVRRRAR